MTSFTAGQTLTAAQLNAAFAQYLATGSLSPDILTFLAASGKANALTALGLPNVTLNTAYGLVQLDSGGKVPSANLPTLGTAWGGITGTLSAQTDLQSALNSKANTSSLATVATTGAYSDLTGKPTLGTAAALNAGTAANNVMQLDGASKAPAVDGSALTNLNVPTMVGDSGAGGTKGLVAAPAAGDAAAGKVWGASGAWVVPSSLNVLAYGSFHYASSTTTVDGQYNVSSISRSATGIYTITFGTALPSTNYMVIGSATVSTGSPSDGTPITIYAATSGTPAVMTTSQVRIFLKSAGGSAIDASPMPFSASFIVVGF